MADNYKAFWETPDSHTSTQVWSVNSDLNPQTTNFHPGPISNPIPVQEFEDFKPSGQPQKAWFASHLITTGLKVVGIIWILILGLFLVTRFTGSPDVASNELDPAAATTATVIDQQVPFSPAVTNVAPETSDATETANEITTAPSSAAPSIVGSSTVSSITTPTTNPSTATTISSSNTTEPPALSTATTVTTSPTTVAPTTARQTTTMPPTTLSQFTNVNANVINQPNAAIGVSSFQVSASNDALRYNISLDCRGRTDRVWLYVNTEQGSWPLVANQPCSNTLTATVSGLNSNQSYRVNLLFGNDSDWRNQQMVLDFSASTR